MNVMEVEAGAGAQLAAGEAPVDVPEGIEAHEDAAAAHTARAALREAEGATAVDARALHAQLVAATDDPRLAEFMAALDRVNDLGRRMPGFVWMMEGSGTPGTGNSGTEVPGDPRMSVNMTVWESVETLEAFVWNTLHRRFYERRAEWFESSGEMHFVMWWVPEGHVPTLDEGLGRLARLRAHGNSDEAFDWSWLEEARRWRAGNCSTMAAE